MFSQWSAASSTAVLSGCSPKRRTGCTLSRFSCADSSSSARWPHYEFLALRKKSSSPCSSASSRSSSGSRRSPTSSNKFYPKQAPKTGFISLSRPGRSALLAQSAVLFPHGRHRPAVEELFGRSPSSGGSIDTLLFEVPIGKFQWKAFSIVTLLFMLEHTPPDWPAAFLTGVLFNLVAIHTRSLSSCVLVHAITNLLLCLPHPPNRQAGFWCAANVLLSRERMSSTFTHKLIMMILAGFAAACLLWAFRPHHPAGALGNLRRRLEAKPHPLAPRARPG